MAIQMRRGEKKDFKPEKLKIGEFAVPTDTGEVYIKTSDDTTKGLATLDTLGKLEQMPMYSDVGAAPEVHKHSTDDITKGVLPVENGGTGGTDIYTAQSNLGLLKRYSDFSHLTLPETLRDVRDIFRLMENNSYIETTVGSNVSSKIQVICPVASGCLKIVRFYNQYTGYAEFYSNPISENSKWIGSLHNDRGFVWNKVYTSNCIIPIEKGGTGAAIKDQALTNLGAASWTQTITDTAMDTIKLDGIYELQYTTFENMDVPSPMQDNAVFPAKLLLIVAYINATYYQIIFSEWGCYIRRWNQGGAITIWKQFGGSNFAPLPITQGGTGANDVISALANMQIYTNVEQLGLVMPCTTVDILNAMPDKSIFITNIESKSDTITDVPVDWGMLKIIKYSDTRRELEFIRSMDSDCVRYFGGFTSSTQTVNWNYVTNTGSLPEHTHDFNSITEKPTTLAGYGINDAVEQSRTINSKPLSSNIELKCTDIGAAPYELKSGTDFNEMKTPGLYTMRSSTTNAPTSGSYHSLIVNKSDSGNYIQQIAIKESSYDMYIRYLSGSSWSAWSRFYTEKNTIAIANGGTGATTEAGARSNLGVSGTILYNNSSGTAGTVTLSASTSNYNYLVIYFYNFNDQVSSMKIYSPNGKTTALELNDVNSAQGWFSRACTVKISGSSIILSNQIQTVVSETVAWGPLDGAIKVTRVEGWLI